MKCVETDGKNILKAAGIAIPEGVFVPIDAERIGSASVAFPAFVKAQAFQGRRGRGGLVVRVEREEELTEAVAKVRTALADVPCAGFLIEPAVEHEAEWLVSADIDGASGRFRVTASSQGGTAVSSAETHLVDSDADVRSLDMPENVRDALRRLVGALSANDALSIEINPLAALPDGSCVALDAKVELDDAAAFRHPEWSAFRLASDRKRSERESAYAALLAEAGHRGTLGRYVELDGDIALVLSGGGASLAAIDALRHAGGRPANYVEMSGNPDPAEVTKAAKIVLSKPGIRAVWIAGSYANFTDIQATVNATLAAVKEVGLRAPVVIRRDGPNADAAVRDAEAWGKENGVFVRFDRADTDFDASARAVTDAAKRV